MFLILIVLLLFYRIDTVYCQISYYDDSPSDGYPPEYLNMYVPGSTFPYNSLSTMISDVQTYDDHCIFHLNNNNMGNYFRNKVIIGQLSQLNQINYVQISFHSEDGDLIRDDYGKPIIYTSTRQDIGHVLDILHDDLSFSYAKFLLKFLPNIDFDLRSLFLHFANRIKPTNNTNTNTTNSTNQTTIITGASIFSIDSPAQNYNVSVDCINGSTCKWLLDGNIFVPSPNTSISLLFDSKYIGNHTLTYVVYQENVTQILASLFLTILPSVVQTTCLNTTRTASNRWILAGDMSSPRVYFTVTLFPTSGNVIVAGGLSDDSNVLSTIDIFDPVLRCYNRSNITSSRKKHAAINYNNSDFILLIGGVKQGGIALSESELISASGSQLFTSLSQARYFPEVANLNNSILIIAGQGVADSAKQIEIYNHISAVFELWSLEHSDLLNVEGHSVTVLGSTGLALIYGGYNTKSYSSRSFLANTTNLTEAVGDSNATDKTIYARAHHQAIFLPSLNAVLITGGNNDTQTFDSCFLYNISSKTFNTTGSMNQKRSFHAAVRLSNDSVLVIGGVGSVNNGGIGDVLQSVERYDPNSQTFTFVTNLNVPRYRHEVVVLTNNEICVLGGIGYGENVLSSIECLKP